MTRSPVSPFVVAAVAVALSLVACSRDEVANRKAPSAAEGAAGALVTPAAAAVASPVAAARAGHLPFGGTCTADADCATGACFRKGASGGGGGSDNGEGSGGGNGGGGAPAAHAVAPGAGGEGAVVVGYCSMPCNGNNDCPTPLTAGKCNGRGFCKKG